MPSYREPSLLSVDPIDAMLFLMERGATESMLLNAVAEACQRRTADKQCNDWVFPVSDEEAARFLVENGHSDKGGAKIIIQNLRQFARDTCSWPDSKQIFYRVKSGFDFQVHASTLGPCYNNWANTSQSLLKNKELTCDSLVFWVPRIVPNSCKKSMQEQLELLGKARDRHHLPENCLASFGSASICSALILSYFKRTGERVPELWIRTDTLHADGSCLNLGNFDERGLGCCGWCWDGDRYSDLGCFPLVMYKNIKKERGLPPLFISPIFFLDHSVVRKIRGSGLNLFLGL